MRPPKSNLTRPAPFLWIANLQCSQFPSGSLPPAYLQSSTSHPTAGVINLRRSAMRSCHELVAALLRSASLAEQEEAAAALAALPMTPRAWRAFVSALPALAEVIRQPNRSAAAMQEHALGVLLPHSLCMRTRIRSRRSQRLSLTP